jgi:hypothetical protein
MANEMRSCVRCGKEIPAERIEAIPETRVCVKCSEAIGGEFEMIAVAENCGRTGAIKRIVGGYTVVQRRKPIRPLGE